MKHKFEFKCILSPIKCILSLVKIKSKWMNEWMNEFYILTWYHNISASDHHPTYRKMYGSGKGYSV